MSYLQRRAYRESYHLWEPLRHSSSPRLYLFGGGLSYSVHSGSRNESRPRRACSRLLAIALRPQHRLTVSSLPVLEPSFLLPPRPSLAVLYVDHPFGVVDATTLLELSAPPSMPCNLAHPEIRAPYTSSRKGLNPLLLIPSKHLTDITDLGLRLLPPEYPTD